MTPIGRVSTVRGDITRITADAIVNAANTALGQGGGVCGAIFRAAGSDDLARACRAIGQCPTGAAVTTPAFAITSARWIIHAVGPVFHDHSPEEARRLLRSAYASAVDEALRHGSASIAFPAISTGIYGYPLEPACREAADECATLAAKHGLTILLVAFDASTAGALRDALARHMT